MSKRLKYDPDEVITVVMKKEMSMKNYLSLMEKLRKDGFNGWNCQGYQTGFYCGYKGYLEVICVKHKFRSRYNKKLRPVIIMKRRDK
ncbi:MULTISPECIES: hypothetical protein [unclassified Apibacter]|uniref:hypothetical protein n=1 Tax=unclassified Apibacter TaxID=2630820 RepID=UPI00132762E7|nr:MULTISPECIES: hypothetical protein [unclassified Apibacter]MCX8676241.1 hypothetical protein [Apibacter sp. B3919]MXO23711.1 hypothetical protein [Apibacter sp. B3924]MXO26611.1 hypothetical protein [Apibacter sp. B3813]MXO29478.1 hypothetical protein [Apibacter sp. B3913]MXO31430.1 hypothetical protein [Apibacter sp. B3912]